MRQIRIAAAGRFYSAFRAGVSRDTYDYYAICSARNEVFAHGDEVVVGPLAVLLQSRLPPRWPELRASADVGQDVDATSFDPRLPLEAQIPRRG